MKRRVWVAASAVAILALALGGVAFASSSHGSSSASAVRSWGSGLAPSHVSAPAAPADAQVITVIARQQHAKNVDADSSGGPSNGDYFIFTDNLYDPNSHGLVGTDHVRCMIVFRAINCEGTGTLDGRGDISVGGTLRGPTGVLAVTGGTGEFLENGGELSVETISNTTTKLTFFLT
jgi:hypothetical protein